MPKSAGNRQLAPGVMEKSRRTRKFVEGGVFKLAAGKSPSIKASPKPAAAASRFYPADDVKVPLKRNFRPTSAKLRASITPGTVLIVLSGRFRGRRVVFLKQLESGLLLVTGPFKVNGVPLRRLNQAYVIATTTKVDISGVDIPAEASEDSFYTVSKAEKKARKVAWAKREESDFFDEAGKAKVDSVEISAAKKDAQAKLDSQLLALPEFKDKVMRSYMASRFTLTKGQMPHAMTF